MAASLHVFLNDLEVGILGLDKHDGCEFRLHESYKKAYPRPILGQSFLDDPNQVWRSRARSPAWFSNLLPEGPLRELVARKAGVLPSREFFLLRLLGEDLPGAVRITADMPGDDDDAETEDDRTADINTDNAWHFSLAGVQLKFSARRSERGLTIPVSGCGGDWIVKLPDIRLKHVPINEFATMRWAAESGIAVPEVELIDISRIAGLPQSICTFTESQAIAVRRFDRCVDGSRVHIEDFAQVLGLYPERKYDKYNYETQANLVVALAGEAGLKDFVRRLVFVIASGNGDAHHKNQSLIYPDGVNAELSPAYDQVSTVIYNWDDKLALNLAKSKRWQDVSMDAFRRLARKVGYREDWMTLCVESSVEAVMNAWTRSAGDFGYDKASRNVLATHFKRIPLLSKCGG